MPESAALFQKNRDFIVCVDSDGCAMDTMDIKHFRCFGPCMVEQWHLEPWKDAILNRWNEINLYSMTRGINRFKGLQKALTEIDAAYCPIPDLASLTEWAAHSRELSNRALADAIAATDSPCLKQVLCWSNAVNQAIHALPNTDKAPFANVQDTLCSVHEAADIAVISSANQEAVYDEWERYGLLVNADVVYTQELGSKAHAIDQILHKGYEKNKVLMCGDAPGDLEAAQKNGVLFFPILVRHEAESWAALRCEGIARLLQGEFEGDYQDTLIQNFITNLGG